MAIKEIPMRTTRDEMMFITASGNNLGTLVRDKRGSQPTELEVIEELVLRGESEKGLEKKK